MINIGVSNNAGFWKFNGVDLPQNHYFVQYDNEEEKNRGRI